ncbi:MAG: DUF3180 domain-containing protein, partial [Angustibacter sp.]
CFLGADMRATKSAQLALLALAVLVMGAAAWRVWLAGGRVLPLVPWASSLGLAAMVALLVVLGWPIRRWQRGDRPQLDRLRAARVLMLAKAAQVVGAFLLGWYFALVLAVSDTLAVSARRSGAVRAGVAGLIAGLLWFAGWLIERWGRISEAGDGPPGNALAPND